MGLTEVEVNRQKFCSATVDENTLKDNLIALGHA